MTEAINIPGSPIADLVLGTIENPLNSSGAEITIGSEQALYSTNYLYCLSLLAGIGYSDFYFTNTKTLNVVNKRQTDLSGSVVLKLKKGDTSSNLTGITYEIDRQNMANEVTVIGGQTGVNLIVKTATNTNGRPNFGLRQRVDLARDLDSEETAQLYANNLLKDYSSVVPAYAINVYPLQDHVPFGNFSLGDVIMADVDFEFTIFQKPMRITGGLISVENNGIERVYYSIEEPKV